MKNSADQGGCYPQRPKAEVDNSLRDLQNSSYPTKAEFNNCFIIHSKFLLVLKGVSPFRTKTQVFAVSGSIICSGLHFWRHFDVNGWRQWFNNFRRAPLLTSLIQYGGDSFQMWWTAAGYGELSVWFWPIRNGEIFWMNDNITYFAHCWYFFDMPNSVSFFVLTWMNIDSLTKVCIL